MDSIFKSVLTGAFVFTFAWCFDGYAQSEAELFTAKNTVFVEGGGNAIRYAASYGRIFHQKGIFKLSGSAGFSIWRRQTLRSSYWLPALPLEISAFLGKSKHHFEIGTGITSFLEPRSGRDRVSDKIHLRARVPLRIGYRYQKPEGGFFFRVGYTPNFSLPGNSEEDLIFHPIGVGLSLGMSF